MACLFFLLLIFILLKSSFVFTPGLRVALRSNDPAAVAGLVQLRENGEVLHQNRTFTMLEFETRLRGQRERATTPLPRYTVEIGSDVKEDDVKRLRLLAEELRLSMRFIKPDIELPVVDHLPGTTNQSVVVAVAQNEQIFFDNQVTRIERLKAQLKLERAKTKAPLTLIIEADQDVRYAIVMRLSLIAREVGFEEILLGGRPKPQPAPIGLF